LKIPDASARQFVPYSRFQMAFALHKLKRDSDAAKVLKEVVPEAKETIQTDGPEFFPLLFPLNFADILISVC